MLVSEKFGALPLFAHLWDHGPLYAVLIMFGVNFGMGCVLMCLEGRPPWRRKLYNAFVLGDGIFFPLLAAGVVLVMQDAPQLHGFYTTPLYHGVLLILGVALSVTIERYAIKSGQYTIGQELSPSKLWHTLVFGVVFYWIVSAVVPVLFIVHSPFGAMVVVVYAAGGWIYANRLDWRHGAPGLRLDDAFLEGTWLPWEWHVRK